MTGYRIIKIGNTIINENDNSYMAVDGKSLQERLKELKQQYNISGKQTVIYHPVNTPSMDNNKMEVDFK